MKQKIKKKHQDKRLDRVLSEYFSDASRSYIKYLIDNNKVKVNGSIKKPSFILKEGDIVEWEDFKKKLFLETREKLEVIFQNKDILAIDKPAGITVHPTETLRPRKDITILDMLISEFPEIKKISKERPGIVHRLDKDTSGVLIIAKNKKSADYLKKEFQERKVKKTYTALIYGKLEPKEGAIDAPVGRSQKDKSKMAVTPIDKGRRALTEYKVIEYLPPGKDIYSLVYAYPFTGRTHQIRVHFASIGHPIVGDSLYGPKKQKEKLDRQFLHASCLGLKLSNGKYKEFNSDLPYDINNFLKTLK